VRVLCTATNNFIKSIFKVLKNDEVHREKSRKKVIKSLRTRANIATKKFVNSIPRFKVLGKKKESSIYSLRAKEAEAGKTGEGAGCRDISASPNVI
jgi:hypothetical protein